MRVLLIALLAAISYAQTECPSGLVLKPENTMYFNAEWAPYFGVPTCAEVESCIADASVCEQFYYQDYYNELLPTSSCCESTDGNCANDDSADFTFMQEHFGIPATNCEDTKVYCNIVPGVRDICPVTCGACPDENGATLPPVVCADDDDAAIAFAASPEFKEKLFGFDNYDDFEGFTINGCADAKVWCVVSGWFAICPMSCGMCSYPPDGGHFAMKANLGESPISQHESSEINLMGYISYAALTTNDVVNGNEDDEMYPTSCTENCCKDCTIGLNSRDFPIGNDIWGWEAQDGTQIVVMGVTDRSVIVDVTDDASPRFLGYLPQITKNINIWKDIKIWDSHAFICSEAPGFGLQYIDLKTVVEFDEYPRLFQPEVLYTEESYHCHNLVINDDIPVLYTASTGICQSIARIPLNIDSDGKLTLEVAVDQAECISGKVGMVHDAQCMVYDGPDTRYAGEEICFLSTDGLGTLAVYSWTTGTLLSETTYANSVHSHQSWISEDGHFLFHGDELDWGNTKTQVFDIRDLTNVIELEPFESDYTFVDHNMYVVGKLLYQSNYAGGLRVMTWNEQGQLRELGYFDSSTADGAEWLGSWSNYPFFSSGEFPAGKKVVISGSEGVHVVQISENLESYLRDTPSIAPETTESETTTPADTTAGAEDVSDESVVPSEDEENDTSDSFMSTYILVIVICVAALILVFAIYFMFFFEKEKKTHETATENTFQEAKRGPELEGRATTAHDSL